MSGGERRLRGPAEFEALLRAGRRREGRYVTLIFAPAAREVGRAGMIVGRKALRRAVDRNRFKRLFREALRRARPHADRFDLIVRVKPKLSRDALTAAAAEAAALLDTAR